MERILIIEDDDILAQGVKFNLELAGFFADTASDLKEAKRKLDDVREIGTGSGWQLLILDVNLPDGDGFAFADSLRKEYDIPMIFLTARDLDEDMMRGFETGADDYITKPFSLMVLRARVDVQLRKSKKKSEVFCDGPFVFDFKKMEFFRDNVSLELSKTEQRLLRCLTEKKGGVSRTQLIDFVWQGDTEYVDDHALTVAVNRLRGKLGEDKECIRTVYGIGYAWVKQ